MWHFIDKKKIWVFRAVDRIRNKTIEWHLGNRSAKTLQPFFRKFKDLKNTIFYKDNNEPIANLANNYTRIGGAANVGGLIGYAEEGITITNSAYTGKISVNNVDQTTCNLIGKKSSSNSNKFLM